MNPPTNLGRLPRQYRQKTDKDCLPAACNLLDAGMPDVDPGQWHEAVKTLRGANVEVRFICQAQFEAEYGEERSMVEVLTPVDFFKEVESYPCVLVVREKRANNDHALAYVCNTTFDPRDGYVGHHPHGAEFININKTVKAALLFPNLPAAACRERLLALVDPT